MKEILIVDDDDQLRKSFEKLLTEENYTVRTAPTGEKGIEKVKERIPDLVVLDIRLPGINGLEAFKSIRTIDAKLPVLIMTAYGTTETAIEATKLGAFDYVLKPFDIPDILSLIEQAIEAGRLMRRRVRLETGPSDQPEIDAIIGQSEAMQHIYKAIGRAAVTNATVLIRGETGTGKELVARALYQHSLRCEYPFLVINCVAIPDTLLESELFGYERGAFTGAQHRHIGKIEQAHRGTILLDEIGDMPLNIQAKLLRLLEEKAIDRLGGHEPISVDVRILAATNRDLEHLMAESRFREDLFYRLNVVTITLPSLRERKDDINLLCDYFLNRFSYEMNVENPGLTGAAQQMLQQYHWPGNVRELANVIKKSLIFNRGYPIRPDDIDFTATSDTTSSSQDSISVENEIKTWIQRMVSQGKKDLFNHLTDRFAQLVLSEVLTITQGNRSQAAQILGLSRPTLLAKIEKYNLKMETKVSSDDE